jgi:hypothetical protein
LLASRRRQLEGSRDHLLSQAKQRESELSAQVQLLFI